MLITAVVLKKHQKPVQGAARAGPDSHLSFSASSRSTYFAQRVCLAGVIGDANMVAALATRDAHGMLERAAARRMRASYRANLGVGYNFHGGGFDGGYSVS